jgi:type IV secretory pathway component VirB8
MLSYIFPLIEKKPIFIRSIDEAKYHFYLQNLKPHPKSAIDKEKYDPKITNLNEAVAKKLVSYYVKEFESYDYRETSFDKVNEKFNKIRNLSSKKVYSDFQNMMSSDNPSSPVNFIGKDIQRKIIINSTSIAKKSPQESLNKAKNFFFEDQIPNQAEVDFTTITKIADEDGYRDIAENYIAKITFEFSGTRDTEKFSYKKNKAHQAINDKEREIKFIVTNYQLLKVKK